MSFSEYYQGFAGLGKAYQEGLDRYDQKTALAKLGDQLSAGDLTGAASTAFRAGDLNSGLGLLKFGETARKERLGAAADAEFARSLGGGFGVGGPIGAPGGGAAPSGGTLSFLDASGASGDYVSNLFRRESNGDPNAQATTSSARGLGQFTTGTWNGLAQQNPDLGLTPVGGGQDGRTDPNQMLRATQALTAQNEKLLAGSGLPVNDATRYSLHLLGGGGGRRFVAGALSNPDAPALSYVGADQAAANRSVFFNRDGSAKSAGQVMGDFSSSFGGGAMAAPIRTAGADPRQAMPTGASGLNPSYDPASISAGTAPLPPPRPAGLGQTAPAAPTPFASAAPSDGTDEADLPAPGAQEAQGFLVPPGGGGSAMPPGLSGNGRLVPGGPPQPGAPATSGGRGMVLPVEAGGPAQPPAPAIPADARIGNVPAAAIAQSPLGQRIPLLMRAVANPNLSEGPRQLAQTMLKQALDETRMPDAVKEYMWARSNGMTQARTPGEYAREKLRDPGQDLNAQIDARSAAAQRYGMQPGTPEFQNYVLGNKPERDPGGDLTAQITTREREGVRLGMQPGSSELRDYALGNKPATERDEGAKITSQIEARRAAAAGLGLEEGTPAWRSYVANGRIGADRDMSASDKKAIADADDRVLAAQGTIDAMNDAKGLSAKAYAGPYAAQRGALTGAFGSERGQATQELDNLVTSNALSSLKSIFGAAPTEGERKILLDIQGSSNLPHALRMKIYDRAITAAQSRLQQFTDKSTELRGQTYYQAGGGPLGRQNAAGASPQPGSGAPQPGSGRAPDTSSPRQDPAARSAAPSAGLPPGARTAPDGNAYVPDPNRPGKYLQVVR